MKTRSLLPLSLALIAAAVLLTCWVDFGEPAAPVGIPSRPRFQSVTIRNATGAEQVTDGTFTTCGAAWTLGADWTCAAGVASKAAGGTTTLSQASAAMVTPLVAGDVLLVVYSPTFSVTTGGVTPSVCGVTLANKAASGTYRDYVRCVSTAALTFTPGNNAGVLTIDNVSLKKVAHAEADQVVTWEEDAAGVAGQGAFHFVDESGKWMRFGAGTLSLPVGSVAINTLGQAPATELQVATALTSSPRGIMSSQHNDGTDGARVHGRKSRGTVDAPLVIVSGDNLTRWVGSGYDGTNYLETASITFGTEGTIASTRVPTNISFWTGTNVAPSVLTQALIIDSTQTATFTGAAKFSTGIVSKSGNASLSVAEVQNTYITMTGAGTLTLPTWFLGARTKVCADGAVVWSMDVASSGEYLVLGGVALAGGNKVSSDGVNGTCAVFEAFKANYWRVTPIGIIADGGA